MKKHIPPFINLCRLGFFFCWFAALSGCSQQPTVLPTALPVVLTNEPAWITLQVISIEILKTPKDLDHVDEFRFFMIAGDGSPVNTARFVHLPTHNIAARVGDRIPGSNFGLSANENALDGTLVVYFAGIDSDQLNKASNLSIDLVTSALTAGLGHGLAAATGGLSEVAAFITDYLLGETKDALQEEDMIGDGVFTLQATTQWGAGEPHTVLSENGSLRLTYRVTRSTNAPGQVVAGNSLPDGYLLFDDFDTSWEQRWWLDQRGQVCQLDALSGKLSYHCENTTPENIVATLHPNGQPGGATGLAVTQQVVESNGKAKLFTNWTCGDPTTERAYHLEFSLDTATAVVYYPQEGWREVILGQLDVSPNTPHQVRIERNGDQMDFFVDDQAIPLTSNPDLPVCAAMRDWGLDLYVWKDGNRIAGTFDRVFVRY